MLSKLRCVVWCTCTLLVVASSVVVFFFLVFFLWFSLRFPLPINFLFFFCCLFAIVLFRFLEIVPLVGFSLGVRLVLGWVIKCGCLRCVRHRGGPATLVLSCNSRQVSSADFMLAVRCASLCACRSVIRTLRYFCPSDNLSTSPRLSPRRGH